MIGLASEGRLVSCKFTENTIKVCIFVFEVFRGLGCDGRTYLIGIFYSWRVQRSWGMSFRGSNFGEYVLEEVIAEGVQVICS